MAKRKSLSKKIRFEVLKRDSFRCQYCGRSGDDPNVHLEVDHIIPVSKGGDNSILNLITSCRDCNRGKGATELSDDTVVVKQKKQLDDLQYRKEMIEMMAKWKAQLLEETEKEIEIINDLISSVSDRSLSETGKMNMRRHINQFGFDETYKAVEIALDKYYYGDQNSLEYAIKKIGGICYNRKVGRSADYYGNKKNS